MTLKKLQAGAYTIHDGCGGLIVRLDGRESCARCDDLDSHAAWPRFKALLDESKVQLSDWRVFKLGWEQLEQRLQSEATDWWCDF